MTEALTWRMGEGEPPAGLGGKARALARLSGAGFPVPPWFAVLPAAFERSAAAVDPAWRERAQDPAAFRTWVAALPLDADFSARLAELGAPCYAVRSSAADEDGAEHSFAGQLDSFLFVPAAEVPRRVAQVWASGFGERLLAYRRERGLDGVPGAPGVVVQAMVDAEAAGVAFSADPVSGRRSQAVVSGVWGLGSGLVSGECDADMWSVGRDSVIADRRIANKACAHRAAPAEHEGVRAEDVPAAQRDQPCLADEQVLAVAALARRAADWFGRPQDIEWAWAAGRLYLLQARPITSLTAIADPDGAWALWDNSNIAESYNGVTTPLTFSFARMAYAAVYEQFCRIMAVPPARIAANRITFARMLGLIRGRVYYNLMSWYRVLALLPGYQVNRRFMEQMMGVKEGLPAAALRQLDAEFRGGSRWRDALGLVRSIAGLAANHWTVERQIRDFHQRLAGALRPPDPPLAARRLDELAAHFHELERDLLLRWDAPLVNDFLAMIFFGLLRDLATRWVGDTEGTLANDLLSGEGGIISTEPARRVRELAGLARACPGLVDALCTEELESLRAHVKQHPAFAAAYHAYLDRFGERCLEELKLETLTLEDHPLPLLRSIGHAAKRGLDQMPHDETRLRRAAEARVVQALGGRVLRRVVFGWVLRHARARVKSRENLRFERTRVFGRVRRVFAEMGRRLAGEGRLDHERDVFYLHLDELLGFVEGTAVGTDLAALARLRQAEFARWRAESPPADRFETTGAVHIGNAFTAPAAPAVVIANGQGMKGTGCCPGVVRGRARVVLNPQQAELQPGDILVAPRTDPGWILLFPAAAGLLVEYGSLLSHSAIVARELGLPAVVGLRGLTTWVQDGDWLELDGAAGTVRKIEAPAS